MRSLRGVLTVLLLLCYGCSGGGSAPGGTAAPPPGPGATTSLQLRLQLPANERISARGELLQVVVELSDPSLPDSSSLSGFRVVASGAASVPPGASEVLILLPEVPRGDWHVQAFGRDGQGQVVAVSSSVPLRTATEALVLTLQLEPVHDDGPVLGLTITPPAPSIAEGTTQQFRALDESLVDVTSLVTWSSSDPSVATIDSAGLATAVGPGDTTIIASRSGIQATARLNVTAVTLVSLAITPADPSIGLGTTQGFTATGTFSDNSTQILTNQVSWSSSDPAVAAIDAAGVATGLTPGPTTIQASLSGVSGSTSLTVLPVTVSSIAVAPADPTLLTSGRTRFFTATATFTDNTTSDVTDQATWTSTNPAVAVVSDAAGTKGQMRTTGPGTTQLQATFGGATGATNLTINVDPIVRLTPPSLDLPTGGNGSQTVTVGDMNNDGFADIVTGNVNTDDVSILLGNGDGTFGAAQVFPTDTFPVGVAVADFNEDGNLDVVASCGSDDDVAVLLGNGDGTLAPFTGVGTGPGSGPQGVAVGDVNADGNVDILTANFGLDTVGVLLGNGDGTFGPVAQFPAGPGTAPEAVAVGDLDGDGSLDLVTSNFGGNSISSLLGNGDGTFGAPQSFAAGNGPVGLALGDMNADGILDAATTDSFSDTASALLGNGDGTFAAAQILALPAGAGPGEVAVGDVNGDGRADIATANLSLDTTSVLLSNGDGTFLPPQDFPVDNGPFGISWADFNQDGCLDLVTANLGFPSTASILMQTPVSP